MRITVIVLTAALAATACRADTDRADRADAAAERQLAGAYAVGSDRLSPEELERERLQMDWRAWVERDTAAVDADTAAARAPGLSGAITEAWDDIDARAVNAGATRLPVFGDVQGPSVLRVQILLDRAVFSPGVIDGRWGRNTEKAVYWLQRREGLRATGAVDEATWERLLELAAPPPELVQRYLLSGEDVAGPFINLPAEWYDRRDLQCQCYESLAEKLAERFHTTEDLLRQLNPGTDLNALRAGDPLWVPAVDRPAGAAQHIARIVVSDGGRYVQAQDANGRIVYHFPATLGSAYSPSPTGDYRITAIAHDPSWHYQPALLEGVPDDAPDAVLPPGPNNAVGVVWMQLSKPHYGIHGTSAPETIGYATSNGCVRLTNWDADFLSRRVDEGVPVEFRDIAR
jgi:lipoprotein-anchoring transpeptidase ErfK/SrfK